MKIIENADIYYKKIDSINSFDTACPPHIEQQQPKNKEKPQNAGILRLIVSLVVLSRREADHQPHKGFFNAAERLFELPPIGGYFTFTPFTKY